MKPAGRALCRAIVAALLAAVVLAIPSGADSAVYWANQSGATIGRAKLDGSRADESFITGAQHPSGVAVDGSHVYWTNKGGGTIGRAKLDGTSENQSFITHAKQACGVAVDRSHVYWTALGIDRAKLDGSSPDYAFIRQTSSETCGVAVDGSHIYWATTTSAGPGGFFSGIWIGRAKLDGSSPEYAFITGAIEPCGVAVDGRHVYWANRSGTIGRAKLDGSRADESFITGASSPCGVAVDGSHVYWANFSGNTIGRAKLDGSSADQSFITGASRPWGVALDPPRISRSLTLGYADAADAFKGSLSSTAAACKRRQSVRVFRKRRGPDRELGQATTRATGAYRLFKQQHRGKYYSTVGKTTAFIPTATTCRSARSPIVRLK